MYKDRHSSFRLMDLQKQNWRFYSLFFQLREISFFSGELKINKSTFSRKQQKLFQTIYLGRCTSILCARPDPKMNHKQFLCQPPCGTPEPLFCPIRSRALGPVEISGSDRGGVQSEYTRTKKLSTHQTRRQQAAPVCVFVSR